MTELENEMLSLGKLMDNLLYKSRIAKDQEAEKYICWAQSELAKYLNSVYRNQMSKLNPEEIGRIEILQAEIDNKPKFGFDIHTTDSGKVSVEFKDKP